MSQHKELLIGKVSELRVQKGLTQANIAEKMGYKYVTDYANIERGEAPLSPENAIILSEILECDLNELYSR